MKNLFFYLCSLLLLIGCKRNETKFSRNEAITEKINKMYLFDSAWNSTNKIIVPKDLFTPDIKKSLNQVLHITETDIQRIKNSKYPTDKPLLMEGSIFTSLYEGCTSHKIKDINIINDKNADVFVALENKYYKVVWTDKIRMVKNSDEWMVENVIFDKTLDKTGKDLKGNLNDFISYAVRTDN